MYRLRLIQWWATQAEPHQGRSHQRMVVHSDHLMTIARLVVQHSLASNPSNLKSNAAWHIRSVVHGHMSAQLSRPISDCFR